MLQELNNNINIETIAQAHNRTVGGIKGRQLSIAYKMYCNKVCINEITTKTKLSKEEILELVAKKENLQKKTKPEKKQLFEQNQLVLDNEFKELKIEIKDLKLEIKDLKFEIKEIKNTVQELVEMMKAVYEFEDNP